MRAFVPISLLVTVTCGALFANVHAEVVPSVEAEDNAAVQTSSPIPPLGGSTSDDTANIQNRLVSPEAVELLRGSAEFSEAPSREITLDEALRLTERGNLPLQIAKTQVRQRRWEYYNRLSLFLPDVLPTYSQQRIQGTFIVGGAIPLEVDATTYTIGATFQYQTFNLVETALTARSQQMLYRAERAELTRTLEQVLLETYENYQTLLQRKAEIAIAEQALAESRQILATNRSQFAAGTIPRLEVLQAEARVSQSLQELIVAQNAFRIQSVTLSRSLNQPVFVQWLPSETTVSPQNLLRDVLSPRELGEVALRNRPEIQRDRFRLRADRANQWVPLGDWVPDVTLARTTQAIGLELNNMPHTDISRFDLSWNVGRNLGMNTLTRLQSQRAITDRSRLALEQTRQEVLQQLTEAFYNARSQREQIEVARFQLDTQRERFRLARLRQEAGLITTTDVITAQVALNRAQLDLARTILQYNIAQARLLRGLGLISTKSLLEGISLSQLSPTKP